jgi:hypothetical protein
MKKKILYVFIIILVIIQFIHPEKNNDKSQQPNYIGNSFPVPDTVKEILSMACNDCHSNSTNYPWYSKIQPVHWWLNSHIVKGKEELNFDEFTSNSLRFQFGRFKAIVYQLEKNQMPLNSYLWIHKNAKLSAEHKEVLITWAKSLADTMMKKYPKDSLERRN